MVFFKKYMKRCYSFLMNFQVFRSFWHRTAIQNFIQKCRNGFPTKKTVCPPGLSSPYEKWAYRNRLTGKMADFIASSLSDHDPAPAFSIVIPVFNTPEHLLRKALQSITEQIYPHWEACIVDDGSDLSHVQAVLEEYAGKDSRFRIVTNPANSGIPDSVNKAISLSTGDYIVFFDSDDLLEPDALAQLAWFIIRNPEADLLYTDNDTIRIDDTPIESQFKPDHSPELLRSMNYVYCKIYRRKFLEKIGLFKNYRYAHDYELGDRAARSTKKIAHIPLILYHWRNTPGSVSKSMERCFSECNGILENSLTDAKITGARVVPAEYAKRENIGIFYLTPAGKFDERISIIVTDRTGAESILSCIQALLIHTGHRNREIIIITPDIRIERTRNTLSAQFPDTRFSCLINPSPGQGTWAAMKNLAAKQATGEFILFIDADLVMESEQCLEKLLVYGKIPGAGIVGGRIHDGNGKILEAGAVFTGLPCQPVLNLYQEGFREDHGYMNVLDVPKNYSLVSGSFFLVNRQVFDRCGGFDARKYPDAFSDYDLCLRAGMKGNRIVSLPFVCLVRTAKRPASVESPAEFRSSVRFFEQWKQYTDPFYNINLSLEPGQSYQVAPRKNNRLTLFPLHQKHTKILSVSHELCTGGAQRVKFRVDSALHKKPDISLEVLCAAQDNGIMKQEYLQENIPVTLIPGYWNAPHQEYCRYLDHVRRIMKEGAYDVVFANTLNCFWAIEAAHDLGIPTVWNIHENYDPHRYFDMIIPDPEVRKSAKSSLVHANRLVFVSRAVRDLFREYDCFGTSDCIYNGIDCEKVDRYLEMDKNSLKSALNLPPGKKIISVIGTITERKGQRDLVDAALDLLATRDDIIFLIIGDFMRDAGTRDYHAQIEHRRGSENRIRIIANPPDVYPYFRITDIFVCTSRIESFALVVQEAMAFCLPVITTTVPGILEQIGHGVTGLTYHPGEIRMLKTHLTTLLSDPDYAGFLGENAGMFVRSAFRESDMAEHYYRLIKTVAMEDVNCEIR
jgi:glycosyltransferase involved in cell wall biosynthesis